MPPHSRNVRPTADPTALPGSGARVVARPGGALAAERPADHQDEAAEETSTEPARDVSEEDARKQSAEENKRQNKESGTGGDRDGQR